MSTSPSSTGQAVDTDIELHYSGGSSNNDPTLSIGGDMSNNTIPDDTQNNVWPDVSGAEAQSGRTTYRCLYLVNGNTQAGRMSNVLLYLNQNTQAQDDEVWIGLGKSGSGFAEPAILNQVTPPIGITFIKPTQAADALRVGMLLPGDSKAFWIKRVVQTNANPFLADYYVLRVEAEAPSPGAAISDTTDNLNAAAAAINANLLLVSGAAGIDAGGKANQFVKIRTQTFDVTTVEKVDDGIGEHEF